MIKVVISNIKTNIKYFISIVFNILPPLVILPPSPSYNLHFSLSVNSTFIFSNSFISMLRIGEESGSLDETLSVTNDFYSEELNIKIEKAMKSVEPIITLVIGLIIGLFIIAMVIPMFDAINSIQ